MSVSAYLSMSLPLMFYSLVFAFPIPETVTPTPNLSINHPTNLTSNLHDNLSCIDLVNPFAHRPKYADCTLAIRQLPQIPAVDSFHNRGPDDPFKLPVERTVGSCSVRVELYAASSTVAASWAGVSTRANTLNRMCLQMTFPMYKGGWATYAKDERIVISLHYPDRDDDGGRESVDSVR